MQKQLGGSAGMFPNGQNINLGWSKFQTFPGEHNPRLLQQYISYYLFILRSHTSGCVVPDHLLYPGYTTSTDLAAWSPASNFKVLSWHSPEPSLFWHPKLSFLVSFSWSVGLWLPDPLSPHIYCRGLIEVVGMRPNEVELCKSRSISTIYIQQGEQGCNTVWAS